MIAIRKNFDAFERLNDPFLMKNFKNELCVVQRVRFLKAFAYLFPWEFSSSDKKVGKNCILWKRKSFCVGKIGGREENARLTF